MVTISSLSTVYVKCRVVAKVNGSAYDPTADTVSLAFVAPGTTPVLGDWHAASWETSGFTYYARCLVGPGAGGFPLAAGTYETWVKVTDNPEIPVLEAGPIQVY